MAREIIVLEPVPDASFTISGDDIPGGIDNAEQWIEDRENEARQKIRRRDQDKMGVSSTIHYGMNMVSVRVHNDATISDREKATRTYRVD